MRPITTLMSEIAKAHPKPIFLFLPRQPTPNANATAITKKKSLSIFLFIFIVILAAKIINGGRCYKCLGSTRLVEVSFSRVCTSVYKKRTNFAITKSINLKSKVIIMVIPFISVLIGISLMYYICQKRAEKEMDEIVNSISPSNDSNENIGTRDLCFELLRQLNCEVRVEHDDIYFTYQNEKFMIEASNDSAFITIWDLHWDMVDSENIQDVENMKKAVNRTNQLVHNTVLYMSYEEEKSYYILSKLQCLLMHNIPNTKVYLAAILNDFFRTKQCYSQVLDDIGKEGA